VKEVPSMRDVVVLFIFLAIIILPCVAAYRAQRPSD